MPRIGLIRSNGDNMENEDFGDVIESTIDWAGYWIEGTAKGLLIVAVPVFLVSSVFAISLAIGLIPMNQILRQVE